MKKIPSILLIDDSKAVNSINESLLASMDLFDKIEKSSNPLDVLNSFENKINNSNSTDLPNIIFLDIEMPEMNAFEFLTRYGKIDTIMNAKNKPYIIILSDHLLKDDNMDASKRFWPEGVADQISKPIEKEDVLNIVEEYLENIEN